MTGYDIRNAMNRAYGDHGRQDRHLPETHDSFEDVTRLQRLLIAFLCVVKGSR